MPSSLKLKLLGAFSGAALLTLIVGLFGIGAVGNVDRLLNGVSADVAPSAIHAQRIREQLFRALWATGRGLDAVRTHDVARVQKARAVRDQAFAEIDAAIRAFDGLPLSPEEEEAWRATRARMSDYAARNAAIWQVLGAGDPNRATQIIDELQPFRDAILDSSSRLIDVEQSQLEKAQAEGEVASDHAQRVVVITTLLGLLAVLGVGLTVTFALTGPIDRLRTAAVCIARGDFEPSLEHRSADEIGALTDSFRQTTQVLRSALSDVQTLIASARAGDLTRRVDASKYQGGFAELVAGMNAVLQAVAVPIQEARRVLEGVAASDLTVRMIGDYSGSFATIKVATNEALDRIEHSLGEAQSAAQQVAAAAGQITTASSQMARGASSQAASIEEVLSSLEEITSMSKQNAANARESSRHAQSAAVMAVQGSERMERLSIAVESIKGAADETAKIIKTIDEIAFQTNLLALNAAVEAARAGDSGRGFAVVAEEVRSLAMRSADAARDTTEVIERSLKKAEEGVAINREASVAFEAIGKQVKKVVEVISEIAESSAQQHDSVARVNRGVDSVSRETQQSAASTEEAASAAEQLAAQAEMMRSLTAEFRLRRTGLPQTHSKPRSASRIKARPEEGRRPALPLARASNVSGHGLRALDDEDATGTF